jgi:hypothetical protein
MYKDVQVSRHDCMDAGGSVPTVGALSDAGAVAEKAESDRYTLYALRVHPGYGSIL